MRTASVVGLCVVLGISGCAAPGGGGSAGENSAGGAAIGVVAGCALAAALGKKCGDGAAIGALIGAVVGWSSYSEKVASAQTVNAEAQREGVRVPTDAIRLKDYRIRMSANATQAGGSPLQVIGDIKLIGQSLRTPDVVQSMTLYKANGEKASETPQIAKVEKVDGAGQYRAVGIYKIPRGMPQGQYTVESVLSIDGERVARRDISFRVASVDRPPAALARLAGIGAASSTP